MSDFISILISALIQLAIATVIPLIWWLATGRKVPFFEWIGLKKPLFQGNVIILCCIVIACTVVYTVAMVLIMTYLLGPTQMATSQFDGKGAAAIPSILVYAIIQTGLSEELFFRGFLCKRLSNRFGFVIGNGIQALIFGLFHGIPIGLATGNVLVCVLMIILPAAFGYLQGWLNEKKSGGSIIPSWILHSLMNMASALACI